MTKSATQRFCMPRHSPFGYFKTGPEIIRLAMLRFRRMRTLQKFAAIHASVHNHFPTERHLQCRDHYKLTRAAALAEWRGLLAA